MADAQTDAAEDGADVAIEVDSATVRFDMDRGVARVLDDVDISIRRKEIFGIVGESGSGKSMLASAMLDAVEDPGVLSGNVTYYPESGSRGVSVLDLSPEDLRRLRWEEVSMVFQGALDSFNPTLNVRQHFQETLSAHDADREEGMERARELLSELHLEADQVLDSYPHELSGGMKQRALIALALVLEPEVLVMDEPTAALDLLMQRSILSLIKKLQRRYDLTIVMISHDLPLIAELADRIGVMYAFDVVEVGRAEDVIENPRHPYTRALLKAVPNLQTPFEEMQTIGGESPDPVNVPDGCSYAPRCPIATDACRAEEPPVEALSPEHHAKCIHTDKSPEGVPLGFTPGSGDEGGVATDGGLGDGGTGAADNAGRSRDDGDREGSR
jgi:oligopeptide/dipeptide ABC transporter ATP-binding protein